MSDQGLLIFIYVIYGITAVAVVVWLARTLFRNGVVFLEDVFEHRPGMADSVNRLLVIGFYMLNLGYALLLLPGERPADAIETVEVLITKLGILLVSLGLIHFINMLVFWRIRSHRTDGPHPTPPPIAPARPPQTGQIV
jgi:hypothetical protein